MTTELDSFLDSSLSLPIGGTVYRVPCPSAADGLRLRNLFLHPFTDAQELGAVRRVLGVVWDDMDGDGVSLDAVMRAGRTALFHHIMDPATAQHIWETGSLPEPEPEPEPEPADPEDLSLPGTYGPDDPGGGPMTAYGVRAWYYDLSNAPKHQAHTEGVQIRGTWTDILGAWTCIELDLHERFGIDCESGVLEHRSWRWLSVRIAALIADPETRLRRNLQIIESTNTDDDKEPI